MDTSLTETTLETSEEDVDKTTLETSEEDFDKTTLETNEVDLVGCCKVPPYLSTPQLLLHLYNDEFRHHLKRMKRTKKEETSHKKLHSKRA